MKNIDIASIQKRRFETYEREKNSLIVTKTDNGYSVSNLNKASIYNVIKDISEIVKCNCKDYNNFKGLINCKHIIAVSKKAVRNITPATEKAGDININKEEIIMANNSKFNPQAYLTKVKGKDYLEVKYRLHWFRMDHPDYSIKTEITHLDIEKGIIIVRADVYDSTGKHLATGHKMEYQKNFFDYSEKSETGAIGRALACLGYGTLQCFELEEGIEKGRIVDAPVTPPNATAKATATQLATKTYPTAPTAPKNHPATVPSTTVPTTAPPTAPAPVTTQPAGFTPKKTSGGNNGNGGGNGKGGNGGIKDIIDRW